MDDAPCEDASSPSAVGLVTPISETGPNYWINIILGAHFRLFFILLLVCVPTSPITNTNPFQLSRLYFKLQEHYMGI